MADPIVKNITIPKEDTHFFSVAGPKDFETFVKSGRYSFLDYPYLFEGKEVSKFALGILRDPKDENIQVIYFRHGKSYVMPEDLWSEIKNKLSSLFPNAKIAEPIDQGLDRKDRDVPKSQIEKNFRNPEYAADDVHEEIVKRMQNELSLQITQEMEAVKTPGAFGIFSRKRKTSEVPVEAEQSKKGFTNE
jgi:hypothetical protein